LSSQGSARNPGQELPSQVKLSTQALTLGISPTGSVAVDFAHNNSLPSLGISEFRFAEDTKAATAKPTAEPKLFSRPNSSHKQHSKSLVQPQNPPDLIAANAFLCAYNSEDQQPEESEPEQTDELDNEHTSSVAPNSSSPSQSGSSWDPAQSQQHETATLQAMRLREQGMSAAEAKNRNVNVSVTNCMLNLEQNQPGHEGKELSLKSRLRPILPPPDFNLFEAKAAELIKAGVSSNTVMLQPHDSRLIQARTSFGILSRLFALRHSLLPRNLLPNQCQCQTYPMIRPTLSESARPLNQTPNQRQCLMWLLTRRLLSNKSVPPTNASARTVTRSASSVCMTAASNLCQISRLFHLKNPWV